MTKKKLARQQRLPGTEDPRIEALHSAAHDYAEVRDERMELTKRESSLKEQLLGIMKKNGKKRYHYGGLTVEVQTVEETVKVRISKEEE